MTAPVIADRLACLSLSCMYFWSDILCSMGFYIIGLAAEDVMCSYSGEVAMITL